MSVAEVARTRRGSIVPANASSHHSSRFSPGLQAIKAFVPLGMCLTFARLKFPRRNSPHGWEHEPVRRDKRHASRVFNDPHHRCRCVRPGGSWKLPGRVYSQVGIRSLVISNILKHTLKGRPVNSPFANGGEGDLIRWDCFSDELGWGKQCVFMLSFLPVQ